MTILIFASELASLLNYNKYTSVNDAVCKLWDRIDKKSYIDALDRNSVSQYVVTNAQKQLVVGIKAKDSKELENKIVQKTGLQDQKMINELKSFIQKEHGTKNEERSIDNFASEIRQKIDKRNDKLYLKEVLPGLKICGRIDGRTENGGLIEMKCRKYRFFDTVPIYEKIQCHCYMYLTGKDEIELIQNFQNDFRSEKIKFDTNLWLEVESKLERFAKCFAFLQKDLVFQNGVINGTSNFYNDVCPNCINQV